MRNCYIIDILTPFDIQEIVQPGGKIIEFHEGIVYRENFKISTFRKLIDNLFCFETEIQRWKWRCYAIVS